VLVVGATGKLLELSKPISKWKNGKKERENIVETDWRKLASPGLTHRKEFV